MSLIVFVFTEQPCFSYVCNTNDCDECGYIKPKTYANEKFKSKSRIINAKPTTNNYYWMAAIRLKVRQRKPPNSVEFFKQGSGGAIISQHSIITVGHALCKSEYLSNLQDGWKSDVTCPQKDPKIPQKDLNKIDLNRKDFNEIRVVVGQKLPVFIDEFDPDLEAYLYNYNELPSYLFSSNGDFGVIIKKTPLIFNYGKWLSPLVGPICLPNTAHLTDSPIGIDVKLAGWGRRYHEVTNAQTKMVDKTTCQTNEARTLNRKAITRYKDRLQFLDCKIHDSNPAKDRTKSFCSRWLTENGLETLPEHINLPEICGGTGPGSLLCGKTGANYLRTLDEQIRCERHILEAREAWKSQGKTIDAFNEEIDRIVVIKSGKKDKEEICYNLKKVAKYGVCMTNEAKPRNWGFCSRSCWASPASHDEVYDVANFTYFGKIPSPNELFDGLIYNIF